MHFNIAGCVVLFSSVIAALPIVEPSLEGRGQNNASPNHVLIGYRVVAEAQAREYHDAGDTLIPTAPEYAAGRQLGEGVYLTPRLHDWAGKRRDWFCAVYADADALNEVAKARIPEDLWFNDAAIDSYIAALGGESLVPRNTLRLGAIKGLRGKQQLVIPPGYSTQMGWAQHLCAMRSG
ncbi:hypothetical protein ACCO45_009879 [Purpureocillium lilacinum]|uniref:Uncharacterized protein n=1 Tax=Purpureocillium lilacinum TaxID=33203 RepID=A0ACC4DHH8_PURLI